MIASGPGAFDHACPSPDARQRELLQVPADGEADEHADRGEGLRSARRSDAHAGVARQEPEWARADAGARGRTLPARERRDHFLSRRRLEADPAEPVGSRADAAMDVLRAVQPRALCRGGAVLARPRAEGGTGEEEAPCS